MTTLVIVESPGKIKKIKEYLGPGYEVLASVGHVRDLPGTREQVPKVIAGEPWAKLGVNPSTFQPYYVVSPGKTDVVQRLKAAHARADRTLLAMDQDREGEAIAWHVSRVIGDQHPQRITFTEITKDALARAVNNPRPLNMSLVGAQEARRILDRLVGYEVSPLLWDAIGPRLSAGRVQSATLLLLVQRDLARMAFRSAEYWVLRADAHTSPSFTATVTASKTREFPHGRDLAKASDFAPDGTLKPDRDVLQLTEAQASAILGVIDGKTATVTQVERSEVRSKPRPPFVTDTLQQAGERLGLSIDQVMSVAQELYEGGYITYMRTDSVSLSEEALLAARAEVSHLFGAPALPPQPRQYATRDKNAQEAHEAIRPSGSTFRRPDDLKAELSAPQLLLYTAIYQRTVASQMHDTVYAQTNVVLTCGPATLAASGRILTFAGHTRLLNDAEEGDDSQALPDLDVGSSMRLSAKEAELKKTSAPGRYTPASLIKAMKSAGIGRPATYQATVKTLNDRGYTVQLGKHLGVSALGLLVGSYLNKQLKKLMSKDFTAGMEHDLDRVAQGELTRVQYLTRAWSEELAPLIRQAEKTPPLLRLPHLEGVTLHATRDGVQIRSAAGTGTIPLTVAPADLKPGDVDKVIRGTYAPKRAARSGGGERKSRAAHNEKAASARPRKPRSGTKKSSSRSR
ncbi:type I DNA topoisomerase [Deinococcus ficus]|uniref:DNA topoisomerase 1 n=1 Tax=Deinococcus ficus TaxID=317577 RepID=A0A221T2W9_9DEIO|nr:type I DNA topoisomerase [Deinococcus ficus]ASN83242.1 DNA topoisomerase I [Deinococcus ficus]